MRDDLRGATVKTGWTDAFRRTGDMEDALLTKEEGPTTVAQHANARLEAIAWLTSTYMQLLLLIVSCTRTLVGTQNADMRPELLAFQGILWALQFALTQWRLSGPVKSESVWKDWPAYLDILLQIVLIGTLQSMGQLYAIILLPLAIVSLTCGFRKVVPFLVFAFSAQLVVQGAFYGFVSQWLGITEQASLPIILAGVPLQYFFFAFFCLAMGTTWEHHRQSEAENAMLVERLGDKYVQLEEVRREMQVQYDKLRRANEQTEESNRKLTSSLAEFFTVQQISQAISSIFDMNELLKFVNDVIIGVMGVSNSTIAMMNPLNGRMKVLVSSIFDKRELAVFTDYINHDIQTGSISTGKSVLDNTVTPEDYRFVQGRDVRSIVSVPLVAKGRALGIVLIEQVIPDAFDNENVRLLEILAQQVSIAIDNARLYQQMQEMATIDGLTGTFNRVHFQNQLTEAFAQAREMNGDLALIMFDIDHFKRFNDTHGHQFGDLVLKSICAWVREHLRKADQFARYGGEEFVILMPHTSMTQAYEKAEELRAGIARMMITDRIISTSVTVSMGVSAFPQTARSEVQLVKAADDALYEAKNGGRNQVRLAMSTFATVMEPLN